MSKENNKIYFSNSPFTNGHKVVDFVWNARLDEHYNFVMDIHLESDQYDEEEEYEDIIEEIDNVSEETTEKSLWINYDHCVLSSTFWNNKGIPIDITQNKLDFTNLNNKTFYIDTFPVDINQPEEDFAFGISMLGKDIPANHEITFIDTDEFGVFDIKWKGKVANINLGETEFNHDFYVYMKRIRFGGVKINLSLDLEKVKTLLKEKVAHYEEFELVPTNENNLEDYIFKLKAR